MTPWALVASLYGLVLAAAALAHPIRRRPVAVAACLGYALIAIGTGTLVTWFWVQLLVPGGLLLVGYWLSGFFFRDPQPWLEAFLLRSDAAIFRTLRLDRALSLAPNWVLELLEASYAADYVVVGGGGIFVAFHGIEAVTGYWSLVLAAELSCYGALPWLRSRPPRTLEGPGIVERRAPVVRRLNVALLDRASVQANTLPSGHVAGAVAAALAVWPIDAVAGGVLAVVAALVAVSAVMGRYHYAIDCAAGGLVATVATTILR